MAELSTVVLNISWFTRVYPVSARTTKLLQIAFVILFALTRVLAFPYMQWRMYAETSPEEFRKLASFRYPIWAVTALQYYWFVLILKKVFGGAA